MTFRTLYRAACGLAACAAAATALAAPSLEAITGAVAGAGNGSLPLGCTQFGPAPALAFFSFSPLTEPVGGIGACGYSGGYTTNTATSGPLTGHSSLGPVLLGPAATGSGSFNGSADAIARYKSLGAAAHANIVGGVPGSQLAIHDSVAAASFADTLTANSPLVASQTAGSVRYQFRVEGSEAAPGAPAPFFFGETYAVLDVQHGGGAVHEVMNAHVRRGDTGTISNGPPPAGWAAGPGSLSGGSTFVSLDLPIVWGQAWDVKVGLLAWAYGTSDSSFLSTATLTGLELFDAGGSRVTEFSISSASGTDYANAVPEPSGLALLLAGLLALAWRRRQAG